MSVVHRKVMFLEFLFLKTVGMTNLYHPAIFQHDSTNTSKTA